MQGVDDEYIARRNAVNSVLVGAVHKPHVTLEHSLHLFLNWKIFTVHTKAENVVNDDAVNSVRSGGIKG